jgi:hypothetical protein
MPIRANKKLPTSRQASFHPSLPFNRRALLFRLVARQNPSRALFIDTPILNLRHNERHSLRNPRSIGEVRRRDG